MKEVDFEKLQVKLEPEREVVNLVDDNVKNVQLQM